MSYAVVLKSLRKRNKMTQVVAAKAIDVTSAYLSKIENGSKVPSMILLERISKVYKIPLSVINYLASQDEISKLKKPKELKAVQKLIDEMIQYLFFEESFTLTKYAEDFKNLRKLKVTAKKKRFEQKTGYDTQLAKPAKASEQRSKYGKRKIK